MERIDANIAGVALRELMVHRESVISHDVNNLFSNQRLLLESKKAELVEQERRVQEEREHGDTSENAAYTIAVSAVSALNLEIQTIESKLLRYDNFVILSKDAKVSAGGVITVGSTICIADLSTDANAAPVWVIKLYPEGLGVARAGGISVDTPLGSALLGHRAGDTITYKAPRGDMRYFIKEVI